MCACWSGDGPWYKRSMFKSDLYDEGMNDRRWEKFTVASAILNTEWSVLGLYVIDNSSRRFWNIKDK